MRPGAVRQVASGIFSGIFAASRASGGILEIGKIGNGKFGEKGRKFACIQGGGQV